MNADTLVDEVIRSDAFKGFGPLLFPVPLVAAMLSKASARFSFPCRLAKRSVT